MPVSVRRTAGVPYPASPAPGLTSGGVAPARWIGVSASAAAAAADRDALGTSARVAAWPPDSLAAVLAVVDAELERLDRLASRFRADSELSRIHRAPGPVHQVSDGLAEAIRVALAAGFLRGCTPVQVEAAKRGHLRPSRDRHGHLRDIAGRARLAWSFSARGHV